MFSWLDLYSKKSPQRLLIGTIKGMSFIKVGVRGHAVRLFDPALAVELSAPAQYFAAVFLKKNSK